MALLWRSLVDLLRIQRSPGLSITKVEFLLASLDTVGYVSNFLIPTPSETWIEYSQHAFHRAREAAAAEEVQLAPDVLIESTTNLLIPEPQGAYMCWFQW